MTSVTVSFRQTVRDPALLGSISWTPKQLEILDSLDGPGRRHVWRIGRQAGKTTMLSAFALWHATLRPDLDVILPVGTFRDVYIICTRQQQSEEVIRTIDAGLEAAPLIGSHARVLTDRVTFELPRVDPDGHEFVARVRIVALPANSRTVRGGRASLVCFDEFGFLDEAGGPGSADQLWRALTPSLRAFGALGRILVSSTPSGRSGRFAELCAQAQADPGFATFWHLPTWDVVEVSEEEKETWRAELGEPWFSQEYGAEEVVGGGAYFDLSDVRFLHRPALPSEGTDWTLALDPATARDHYGYAVLGRSIEDPDELLLGPAGALATGWAGGGLLSAQAETNGFLENSEQIWQAVEPFRDHGLRVVSDVAKVQAVKSFYGRKGVEVEAVALRGEEYKSAFVSTKTRLLDSSLRIWECPDLIEDLRMVQLRDSGTIHLPRIRGRHADSAAALVLACWELRDGGCAAAGERADAWASETYSADGWGAW